MRNVAHSNEDYRDGLVAVEQVAPRPRHVDFADLAQENGQGLLWFACEKILQPDKLLHPTQQVRVARSTGGLDGGIGVGDGRAYAAERCARVSAVVVESGQICRRTIARGLGISVRLPLIDFFAVRLLGVKDRSDVGNRARGAHETWAGCESLTVLVGWSCLRWYRDRDIRAPVRSIERRLYAGVHLDISLCVACLLTASASLAGLRCGPANCLAAFFSGFFYC